MAEPEWRRVAAEIRQKIRDDDRTYLTVRPNGDLRLPTYPKLIERHATSYGTLRTALIALEAEGWIDRRPGVGLLVRDDHPK
jgi:DNA-binding GntR family transcriptional regulator